MTPKSPLTSRLEQDHPRRDRHIEAPDRTKHGNRDQTVAVLPNQSPQPRAFGAKDDGGRQRQIGGVVPLRRFTRQPDGPHTSGLQLVERSRDGAYFKSFPPFEQLLLACQP